MKNRRVRFDKDSKEVDRQSTAISSSSEDEIPPAAAPPGVDVSAALSPAQKQKDSGIKDRKIKDGNSEEVWLVRNDERWEVTWPIWHMLPRDERKSLAVKHGYKSIGEFEEYMSLQRAVGYSTDTTAQQQSQQRPYDNDLIYSSPATTAPKPVASERKTKEEEDDLEDDDNAQKEADMEKESEQVAAADKLPMEDLIEIGGTILFLPEEMLHRIFDWLPVDTYATLALVSPHWKSFTRTEMVYKRLCERLYLNQSKRKALHVNRFGNSYRTMLLTRPRVRAGGGVYVMKYSRVKKIQRDMWTEVRKLQCVRDMPMRKTFLFLGPCHSTGSHFLRNACDCEYGVSDSRWQHFRNYLLSLLVFSRKRARLICSHIVAAARGVSPLSQVYQEQRTQRPQRRLGKILRAKKQSDYNCTAALATCQIRPDYSSFLHDAWALWVSFVRFPHDQYVSGLLGR